MQTRSQFITKTCQAILIWLTTNVLASVFYIAGRLLGILDRSLMGSYGIEVLGIIVVLGLLLSAPIILVLIPSLFQLDHLQNRRLRIIYSVSSVLIMSSLVVMAFIYLFNINSNDVIPIVKFLIPYVIAAQLSFFLVARQSIIGTKSIQS
jgi:hypothetical protein